MTERFLAPRRAPRLGKWLLGGALTVLPVALSLPSCGGPSCGPGTEEVDGVCVVEAGMGGFGGASAAESFEGVVAAAPVSRTSLMAVWTPEDDPDVSYRIYVATSRDGFSYVEPQAVAPAGAGAQIIGNLEAEETYFVQVRAVDDAGEAENDATAEVTLADDTEAPTFAGITEAEGKVGARIEVSWDAAEDDLSPPEAIVYLVYAGRTFDDIDFRSPVAISLPGVTSTVAQLPEPDTEYVLAVRARDAAGNVSEPSDPEDEPSITEASGADEGAPVFGGCRAVVAQTASALLATWEPATDDVAASEDIVYELFASETPDGFNFEAPDGTATDGATSGVLENLERDTPYYVLCRARDPSDNSDDNSVLVTARTRSDDVPPEFTGPVAVSDISTTSATLSWPTGSDNETADGDLEYYVFLAPSADGFGFDDPEFDEDADAFAVTPPGATEVELAGLDSNTTYYVTVLARDEGQILSEPGDPVFFTTEVSFQLDVLSIFAERQCATTECHGGAAPLAGMNLSAALAYDQLVGVETTTFLGTGFLRVEPGNAADSHLVHRLKGTGPLDGQGIEARMPNDGNLLTDEQIAAIELWITEGAENN